MFYILGVCTLGCACKVLVVVRVAGGGWVDCVRAAARETKSGEGETNDFEKWGDDPPCYNDSGAHE